MNESYLLELLPIGSLEFIKHLISEDRLYIIVVNIRRTKHGDFRKLKNGFNQKTFQDKSFGDDLPKIEIKKSEFHKGISFNELIIKINFGRLTSFG